MRRLPAGPFLVLLALGLGVGAWGSVSETVTLENEAIRLVVNNTDDGRGRFAVDVTGGDRTRLTDDGQPLIYGRPVPWTSFTTIRLDGRYYAFGGATTRRAGKGLAGGVEVTPPAAREAALVTAWRYGDLEITQHLSITEGPTTGRPDTARIAYTLVNRGSVHRRVGLRVCLDAMLGSNDGAPFRLGQRQILTDEVLRGTEIEPYWQAFDSLEDPRVIAQGTLAGGELTPPDRIYFSNWGTLADDSWEPALVLGRDFTRLGEFEPDSAVALLWDEVDLAPGGVLNRIAYYGLGGVSIAQGQLSLGLTAPASVGSGQGNTFMVLGYLENRGEGVAQEVALTLELPPSLRPLSPLRVELGRVRPGESRQVAWTAEAVGAGTARIKATAEAFRLPPIAVEREIRLVAPARLEVKALEPPVVQASSGRYVPYPVPLTAVVANRGGDTAAGVWAQIAPAAGLELAPGEGRYRWLGPLAPGQEARVTWAVVCGGPEGPAGYTVLAGGNGCPLVKEEGSIQWPGLPRRLLVSLAPADDRPGWYRVDLSLINLPEAAQLTLRVVLSGEQQLAAVQRGGFLVCDGIVLPWASPPDPRGGSLILEAVRPAALDRRQESLATLWLAGWPGTVPPRLTVEVLRLLDPSGRPLPVNVVYETTADPADN